MNAESRTGCGVVLLVAIIGSPTLCFVVERVWSASRPVPIDPAPPRESVAPSAAYPACAADLAALPKAAQTKTRYLTAVGWGNRGQAAAVRAAVAAADGRGGVRLQPVPEAPLIFRVTLLTDASVDWERLGRDDPFVLHYSDVDAVSAELCDRTGSPVPVVSAEHYLREAAADVAAVAAFLRLADAPTDATGVAAELAVRPATVAEAVGHPRLAELAALGTGTVPRARLRERAGGVSRYGALAAEVGAGAPRVVLP